MEPKLPDRYVIIDYTNYRGERSTRRITPIRMDKGPGMGGAANEWHPRALWLLHAFDLTKGAFRDFALDGIHEWTEVHAALPTGTPLVPPAPPVETVQVFTPIAELTVEQAAAQGVPLPPGAIGATVYRSHEVEAPPLGLAPAESTEVVPIGLARPEHRGGDRPLEEVIGDKIREVKASGLADWGYRTAEEIEAMGPDSFGGEDFPSGFTPDPRPRVLNDFRLTGVSVTPQGLAIEGTVPLDLPAAPPPIPGAGCKAPKAPLEAALEGG